LGASADGGRLRRAALREDAGLTVVVTDPGEELAHPATAAITGSANRAAFADSEAIGAAGKPGAGRPRRFTEHRIDMDEIFAPFMPHSTLPKPGPSRFAS
jgi:hypothetical protein